MKRIKSEENHEKTNDVNFQGTALFGKWQKKTSMILEERKRMSMEMSM